MQDNQVMRDNSKDIQKGEDMKKIINKINVWSLYYRAEIVWFVVGFAIGFVLGVIIL